jgi:4a-hydroxytetrahydrobiopterin dehydratase
MVMSVETLSPEQIEAADLVDWRPILQRLVARFDTGDFATGLRLVNLIGEAAESARHHPDVDLRYGHVNVRLTTQDAPGITQRDVGLARRISEIAAALGVGAQPSLVCAVEIALDTPDFKQIKPFWRAALGYRGEPEADDEVRADDSALPTMWFQQSGSEEPRQRFHLDLRVPPEVMQDRIDAAVAAGGKVVDEAATFTVLADADGNRMCVCRS